MTNALDFVNKFLSAGCPRRLTIEITNSCNLRCIHCYHPSHCAKNMELDVILAAVKQFKEMGLSHVSLTGGEIFLYPKLKELIIALKKFNLSITLLTNATMIKAEWIDFFKKQEIQEIQISIYGAEENIYNTVTNTTGIFRNHLESLERLGESGIPVTCSLIMMRENFENRNAITHGDGSFVLTSALIYAKV